jgi:holin-like protein
MATIFILIALQLVGEAIASVAGLPIPGAVIGLVLLFVILCLRRGPPEEMTRTAAFLHDNLGLLFVPAGVGVIAYLPLIADAWLPIAAALLVSVTASLAVTSLTLSLLSRRLAARRG